MGKLLPIPARVLRTFSASAFCAETNTLLDLPDTFRWSMAEIDWWCEDILALYGQEGTWVFTVRNGAAIIGLYKFAPDDSKELFEPKVS